MVSKTGNLEGERKKISSIACLSTDTKPLGGKFGKNDAIINGCICWEMDTKKIYMYDADNDAWWEV